MIDPSYQHTQIRVRLAKKGIPHVTIDELFRNFTLKEIELAPARLNWLYKTINEGGTQQTYLLVRMLIEFLMAHDSSGLSHFEVECIKKNGQWTYVIKP